MRISDWSSDVCSSDLGAAGRMAEQSEATGVDRKRRGKFRQQFVADEVEQLRRTAEALPRIVAAHREQRAEDPAEIVVEVVAHRRRRKLLETAIAEFVRTFCARRTEADNDSQIGRAHV